MDFFEFLAKRNVVTGLAIGLGITVLGPILVPAVTAVIRPAAKGVLKAGMIAYDRTRVALAEAGEGMEDLYAEARSEMHPTVQHDGGGQPATASQPEPQTAG